MTHTIPSHIAHRIASLISIVMLVLLPACGSTSDQSKSAIFTVGILKTSPALAIVADDFKSAMTDLGYSQGKNVTYVDDGLLSDPNTLATEVKHLVDAKVSLIFAPGTAAAMAAKTATAGTNIPIVFAPGGDPIQRGLVQSVANPGGNVTGVATWFDYVARDLEYLKQLVPGAKRVFVPYKPGGIGQPYLLAVADAAKRLGMELVLQTLTSDQDATAAVANIPTDVDAVLLIPDDYMNTHEADLIKVTLSLKVPLLANRLPAVDAGALLAYGWDNQPIAQQAASIADKILKGATPASIPVESAEFFLSVNLKTAQAIGISVPDDVLRQANTKVQ